MESLKIGFEDLFAEKQNIVMKTLAFSEELLTRIESNQYINEDCLKEIINTLLTDLFLQRREELVLFAEEQGIRWADAEIPFEYKMELCRTTRKLIWQILRELDKEEMQFDSFFDLEQKINELLDYYISNCLRSYLHKRNAVIDAQQLAIDELTAPVIPVKEYVAVVPIIGTINSDRSIRIREKVTTYVNENRLRVVILDLSGMLFADTTMINYLFQLVESLKLLGCRTIFTGIKASIATSIVDLGVPISDDIEIHGNLKIALAELT